MTASDCKVMLVDDDPSVRKALAMMFEFQGWELVEVGDADKAIEVALEEKPDCVILDIGMPGIDGLRLCRMFRERDELSSLPVMILSGYADKQTRNASYRAGACAFLAKPLAFDALLKAMQEVIPSA